MYPAPVHVEYEFPEQMPVSAIAGDAPTMAADSATGRSRAGNANNRRRLTLAVLTAVPFWIWYCASQTPITFHCTLQLRVIGIQKAHCVIF